MAILVSLSMGWAERSGEGGKVKDRPVTRRVGNGAILGVDAWAKSLGAVAHASRHVGRFCPPYEAVPF
jgi:hypothetical protein